ncbi:unnamed protein product [Linum trigynum]|uniref:Uncharacterized protein n=1 Tax=Linum trigynum TaxID=586398 RepID=A0AAV2EWJ8_9ROSI
MTVPSRVTYHKLCENLIQRIRRRDEAVQDSDMITGFTYYLPEWMNDVLFHYAMPINIMDDDSLNALWNFMAQNLYCLGAEIHAELSEHQGEEEEDETWSVPSDHDDDDGDGEEEEEEEDEDEDGEGEQPNYPPYFYLQGVDVT